jgi:hypothetical protein
MSSDATLTCIVTATVTFIVTATVTCIVTTTVPDGKGGSVTV